MHFKGIVNNHCVYVKSQPLYFIGFSLESLLLKPNVNNRPSTNENLVLTNKLIEVELPLLKIWKTDVSSASSLSQ